MADRYFIQFNTKPRIRNAETGRYQNPVWPMLFHKRSDAEEYMHRAGSAGALFQNGTLPCGQRLTSASVELVRKRRH